jgi:hypothetical protein
MGQERIELGKVPQLTVECHGSLVVRGEAETAVLIRGSEYETHQDDTGLTITGHSDLKLTVPHQTALAVRFVGSDLVIKRVHSDISLSEIGGDVVLSGVSNVKLQSVHGDLTARQLDGSLSADTIYGDAACHQMGSLSLTAVHGDLSARHLSGGANLGQLYGDASLEFINGDITLQQCHRDVNVREVGGLLTIQQAYGDIRLRSRLSDGEHFCRASGDIVFRWPTDAPINIEATAPVIKNTLPLENMSNGETTLTGHIGAGKTHLKLIADGRIVLKEGRATSNDWEPADEEFAFSFGFDMNNLGERISREVEAHVSRLTANLQSQFGPDYTQDMADRIARQAEKAAAKAERAAERAAAQAQRQAEKMARRHGSHGRWAGPIPPQPPRPPYPPRPSQPPQPSRTKATTEEQLKILKMVEQGIITPEEANTLLEAIEG